MRLLRTTYSGLSSGQFPATDQYYRKVQGYRPVGYWPQWEAAGTIARGMTDTARNGTYVGVTLLQAGIGDGRTSPFYDGANGYMNVHTASFAAAFDGTEGTIAVWGRVSGAGVWTDGVIRHLFRFQADANNFIFFAKNSVNDQVWARRRANSTNRDWFVASTNVNWFHVAMTYSQTANQAILYLNAVQQGAALVADAWAGALATAYVASGPPAPSLTWSGYAAHCAIYRRALSPTEIYRLASVH